MTTKSTDLNAGVLAVLPELLARPLQSLQELPLEFRWEVTRRHPYYLLFRESAQRNYDGNPADPLRASLGLIASEVLLAIGISGNPPPPTASVNELGIGQLADVWKDGAVAPLTYRALAGLLADLPRKSRMDLGSMLLVSSMKDDGAKEGDVDEDDHRRELVRQLIAIRDPALDRTPNRPIFGVNLFAPQKAILGAVEHMVSELKRSEGIPERRRRHKKLEQYLHVWDLREGWSEEGYDPAREMSFAQIATKMGAALATVANQYASAFQLISGHPHTFTNWYRLFAVLKLIGPYGPACLRRRHVNAEPRQRIVATAITEEKSVLAPPDADPDRELLAVLMQSSDLQVRQTLADIETLVRRNLTTNAILKKLEPENPNAMRAVVKYLRGHIADTGNPPRKNSPIPTRKRRRG
jgi:hypothetical protein